METSLGVDQAVLELNTIGTISITKAVLPHMVEQEEGCIVVTSSIAGKIGEYDFHTRVNVTDRTPLGGPAMIPVRLLYSTTQSFSEFILRFLWRGYCFLLPHKAV